MKHVLLGGLWALLALSLALGLPGVRDHTLLAVAVAMAVVGAGAWLHRSWRLHALMRWLRAPRELPAPLIDGPWGDLAYRMQRTIEQYGHELRAERRQRQDFLSAIEASPNGILLLDAEEQVMWLNSLAGDHFSLHPERDLRQRITNLVRHPSFVTYLQGRAYQQPLQFLLHDGRTLQVVLREYGDGARLLLSQDVSERERNETMRRDFMANASHEIRTPLAALAGFVESLQTLPLTEPERRRVLDLMQSQARRMQALVDDLLALAKLEGSARPPADRWWPLGEVVEAVRCEVETLSAGRHRIEWQLPTSWALSGVAAEFHSALGNLAANAVRYTPDGGAIRIQAQVDGQGDLVIEVRDTGIGIPSEHIGRLAERFYRVDGSRSRETGGTGLGLSIVKQVVQRHGGELRIQSEPGEGSTFTLVWPARRVRAAAADGLEV